MSRQEWAFGLEGDWCKRGIDPWWVWTPVSDGRQGFQVIPDSHQKLIYNETDCKLSWQSMRLKIDTSTVGMSNSSVRIAYGICAAPT